MRVYIMRHGPAEDAAPSGRDFDRALTAAGRDRVRDVARVLVAEGEVPRLILSSPLVRALQTAEIVAGITKLDGVVTTRRELAPGGDGVGLLRELLSGKDPSLKRVMWTGHEPDLSSLVVAVAGHPMPAGMAKAMVAGLSCDTSPDERSLRDRVRLRFLLDPKSLALYRPG